MVKEFQHRNVLVKGVSIGGIESSYILPHFKVAFDFGRCPDDLIDVPTIFLTHGHLDHSAGIAYYFSQRSLKNLPEGKVYVPAAIKKPIRKILKLWHKIEQFEYKIQVEGINHHQKVEIRKNVFIKALPAFHRIPAQGYVLLEKKRKLKKEYIALSGRKIEKLKKQGEDIFEEREIPLFCYSGDTDIRFLENNKEAQQAKVLLLECTYIDDKRPPERAHKWGHIHLYDILDRLDLFQNEKIVLIHFSKRYKANYINKILSEKLPAKYSSRFISWPQL
ncbi:MAG: ribonuclease Z [Candidatus Hydrogenedentota bacterium]|nr:MAG: ribonuclease Z [Candidatus Hydrogenedentota bacterium]